MNLRNHVRTLAMGSMLALAVLSVPAVHVHAEPNEEGIEIDCRLGGNWVVNGGYVIAKDGQGVYHRVFCVNGQWVDGGPILSYITTQPAPTGPVGPKPIGGILAR